MYIDTRTSPLFASPQIETTHIQLDAALSALFAQPFLAFTVFHIYSFISTFRYIVFQIVTG